VIIFLDACHSGAAGNSGTNDDAVSALLNRKSSITVIAASKGHQESLEFGSGGAFTTALVTAISEKRQSTDTNRNGVIELAELYGAVKRQVVTITKGQQTPWLARNLMVGETPLF
jgi:Caspase domain